MEEFCDFPDHFRRIEKLNIENELLKEQLSYEKSKNAMLTGELSTFKELARRVLYGDRHEKSWDSRHEAFIGLVGGLLGFKSKNDMEDQDYEGHNIPRKSLGRQYLGKSARRELSALEHER